MRCCRAYWLLQRRGRADGTARACGTTSVTLSIDSWIQFIVTTSRCTRTATCSFFFLSSSTLSTPHPSSRRQPSRRRGRRIVTADESTVRGISQGKPEPTVSARWSWAVGHPTVNRCKPASWSYLSEVHLAHLVRLERKVREAKTEQMDFQAFQVMFHR